MKSWVVDIDRDDIATATTAEVDLQIGDGEILMSVVLIEHGSRRSVGG